MKPEPNNCTKCNKDQEELFARGLFYGNMNDSFFCKPCYKKVHDEAFGEIGPREREVEKTTT